MSRVLNTTTGSSVFIDDIGISINPGEPYTIHPNNYGRFAASVDIDTLIDNGDITLTLFAELLTPVDAKRVINELSPFIAAFDSQQNLLQPVVRYIEVDGVLLSIENLGDGQVRLKSRAADTNAGRKFNLTFSSNGTTINEYLGQPYNTINGNRSLTVLPWDCSLEAITFTNNRAGVDTDLQIRWSAYGDGSNDSIKYTWEIRDGRTCVKNDLTIPFNKGDKIAIYLDDQGTNAVDVSVNLYFKIQNDSVLDDCENFNGDFGP